MSHINFDLRQISRSLMDALLPRGSGDQVGLQIVLRTSARVYLDFEHLTEENQKACENSEDDDGVYESITELSSQVHANILLMRPSNYTRVLVQSAIDHGFRDIFNREGTYIETCYHDSGWDDGFHVIDKLIQTQANEIREKMKGNVKMEHQDAIRVTYDTTLEGVGLKNIIAEDHEDGSRKWTIKFTQ